MCGVCAECGKAAVEWDDQGRLFVCTQCGAVDNDSVLTHSDTLNLDSHQSTHGHGYSDNLPAGYVARTHTKVDPEGLIDGVRHVLRIARAVSCTSDTRNAAVDLYKNAYRRPNYIHRKMSAKRLLAAACVHIVSSGRQLMIGDIVTAAGVDLHQLARAIRELSCETDTPIPQPQTAVDLVPVLAGRAGLTAPIEKRAVVVLRLCRAAWLVDGRSPVAFAAIALYLSWQAEQPVQRRCVSITDFCLAHGLEPRKAQRRHLVEVLALLLTLASHVPWIQAARLKKGDIILHLDDICSLQAQLLTACEETGKGAVENGAGDSSSVDTDGHAKLPDGADSGPSHQPAGDHVKSADDGDAGPTRQPAAGSCGETRDKPGLFRPPCWYLRPDHSLRIAEDEEARRLDVSHIDDVELTEKDIADEDLVKYLKRPEEVEASRKMLRQAAPPSPKVEASRKVRRKAATPSPKVEASRKVRRKAAPPSPKVEASRKVRRKAAPPSPKVEASRKVRRKAAPPTPKRSKTIASDDVDANK